MFSCTQFLNTKRDIFLFFFWTPNFIYFYCFPLSWTEKQISCFRENGKNLENCFSVMIWFDQESFCFTFLGNLIVDCNGYEFCLNQILGLGFRVCISGNRLIKFLMGFFSRRALEFRYFICLISILYLFLRTNLGCWVRGFDLKPSMWEGNESFQKWNFFFLSLQKWNSWECLKGCWN